MNTSEKLHLGNTRTVNVVVIGLPLLVLGVSTAGVLIGKKNVFGEEELDPICNYLNCNHAFSLHKDNNNHCTGATCNCQHPQNTVIGLRK
jgi:hypothetical protein